MQDGRRVADTSASGSPTPERAASTSPSNLKAPWRPIATTLLKVGVVVFLAELVVMYILPLIGLSEGIWENLADGLMLTLLAVPVLYAIGFCPPSRSKPNERRHHTHIERRTVGLLTLLVGLVSAFLLLTILLAPDLEKGFAVINAAGRQRMLSQRMIRDSNALRTARLAGGESSPELEARIHRDTDQFERVLNALVQGDSTLGLNPCPSEEASIQLAAVRTVWESFRALLIPPVGMETEGEAHRLALETRGGELLARLETAVGCLEEHYTAGERRLQSLQGINILALLVVSVLLVAVFIQLARYREHLTNELIDSEAQTRAIVDSAADGIITIDVHGLVQCFNAAAEAMFGYAADEILGRKINILMPAPYCDEHDSYLGAYLQTGVRNVIGTRRELTGRRKDGSVFPIELHVSVNSGSSEKLFTGLVTDIRLRKQAEDRLRESNEATLVALHRERETSAQLEATMEDLTKATREAQAANQSKSDFLANMSHEIRTPMTAILGFADELEANVERPEDRDAARTIKRNGQYLLRLINDILDLSKIEAGRMTVEAIPVSPLGIVEEVKSLMQVRAQERGLTLASDYVFPLPETIATDPIRLRQILVNLVGNGIKFTETGSVTVRATFENGLKPQLRFEVIDTGIGMSAEAVQGLFQPFTQVDSSTTRRFGGTGLGLAVCKRLAKILGGGISVTSEPGCGSTFGVTVATGSLDNVRIRTAPRAEHHREDVSEASPGITATDLGCRILLVEDGPDNQRLISLILERAGAKVTVAENGLLGVERALQSRNDGAPFDVILMDMQMPVMDGLQAVRRLRQSDWSGPIIALTADAMSGDRVKCLAAGCTEYTTKPIVRKVLIGLIREQLETHSRPQMA